MGGLSSNRSLGQVIFNSQHIERRVFVFCIESTQKRTRYGQLLHFGFTELVQNWFKLSEVESAKKLDGDKRRELRRDEECDLSLLGLQLS